MRDPRHIWRERCPLLSIVLAPLPGAIIASIFNIWYNAVHIRPLLTNLQHDRFLDTVLVYNTIVYPLATFLWFLRICSVRGVYRKLIGGGEIPASSLVRARTTAIHLPWFFAGLCCVCWLGCIPIFLGALELAPGELPSGVVVHLTVSFVIAGLINLTHGFFTVELTTQRILFPVLFREARPADTPGVVTLSLRKRGLLLTLSCGACPILSLLLLELARDEFLLEKSRFGIAVGGVGIIFGLISARLLGKLVGEPVEALRRAARSVSAGNLDSKVDILRADEFGPLIDEFNHMIQEMKAKEKLRQTFGLHVGEQAARQILSRDPSLGGRSKDITVLFCDIRNFTSRSASSGAREVVELLNLFLTEMVEIVEGRHDGMVNKFLGDGFMALFGVQDGTNDAAERAVSSALDMLGRLDALNLRLVKEGHSRIEIGIGIHSGEAIVGSIGSPRRMEFTAIGDVINLASRLEELTKTMRVPLLISAATRAQRGGAHDLVSLGSHKVRGCPRPVDIFTSRSAGSCRSA